MSENQPLILFICHANPIKAELAEISKMPLLLAILKFKFHWIVIKQQLSLTYSIALQTSLEKGKKDKRDLFYIYLSISQTLILI